MPIAPFAVGTGAGTPEHPWVETRPGSGVYVPPEQQAVGGTVGGGAASGAAGGAYSPAVPAAPVVPQSTVGIFMMPGIPTPIPYTAGQQLPSGARIITPAISAVPIKVGGAHEPSSLGLAGGLAPGGINWGRPATSQEIIDSAKKIAANMGIVNPTSGQLASYAGLSPEAYDAAASLVNAGQGGKNIYGLSTTHPSPPPPETLAVGGIYGPGGGYYQEVKPEYRAAVIDYWNKSKLYTNPITMQGLGLTPAVLTMTPYLTFTDTGYSLGVTQAQKAYSELGEAKFSNSLKDLFKDSDASAIDTIVEEARRASKTAAYVIPADAVAAMGKVTQSIERMSEQDQQVAVDRMTHNKLVTGSDGTPLVELSTGELISRQDFEGLSPVRQAQVFQLGIATTIMALPNDSMMWKDDFVKLPEKTQAAVLAGGTQILSTEGLTPQGKFDKLKSVGLISATAGFAGVDKDGNPLVVDADLGSKTYNKLQNEILKDPSLIGWTFQQTSIDVIPPDKKNVPNYLNSDEYKSLLVGKYNSMSDDEKTSLLNTYANLKELEGAGAVPATFTELGPLLLGKGIETFKHDIEKLKLIYGVGEPLAAGAKVVGGAAATLIGGGISMIVFLPLQVGEEMALSIEQKSPAPIGTLAKGTFVGMYDFFIGAAKGVGKLDPWAMGEMAAIVLPVAYGGIKLRPKIATALDSLYTKSLTVPVMGKGLGITGDTAGAAIKVFKLEATKLKGEASLALAKELHWASETDIAQGLNAIKDSTIATKIKAVELSKQAIESGKQSFKAEYAGELKAINDAYLSAKAKAEALAKSYKDLQIKVHDAIAQGKTKLANEYTAKMQPIKEAYYAAMAKVVTNYINLKIKTQEAVTHMAQSSKQVLTEVYGESGAKTLIDAFDNLRDAYSLKKTELIADAGMRIQAIGKEMRTKGMEGAQQIIDYGNYIRAHAAELVKSSIDESATAQHIQQGMTQISREIGGKVSGAKASVGDIFGKGSDMMTAFKGKIGEGIEAIKYTDVEGSIRPYEGVEFESVVDGGRLIGKLAAGTAEDIRALTARAEYAGYKVESVKYEMPDGSTGYDWYAFKDNAVGREAFARVKNLLESVKNIDTLGNGQAITFYVEYGKLAGYEWADIAKFLRHNFKASDIKEFAPSYYSARFSMLEGKGLGQIGQKLTAAGKAAQSVLEARAKVLEDKIAKLKKEQAKIKYSEKTSGKIAGAELGAEAISESLQKSRAKAIEEQLAKLDEQKARLEEKVAKARAQEAARLQIFWGEEASAGEVPVRPKATTKSFDTQQQAADYARAMDKKGGVTKKVIQTPEGKWEITVDITGVAGKVFEGAKTRATVYKEWLKAVEESRSKGATDALPDRATIESTLRDLKYNIKPLQKPPEGAQYIRDFTQNDGFELFEVTPEQMKAIRPDMTGDVTSAVTGKFFLKETPDSPAVAQNAIIIVRGASRRTLLHEIGHAFSGDLRTFRENTPTEILRSEAIAQAFAKKMQGAKFDESDYGFLMDYTKRAFTESTLAEVEMRAIIDKAQIHVGKLIDKLSKGDMGEGPLGAELSKEPPPLPSEDLPLSSTERSNLALHGLSKDVLAKMFTESGSDPKVFRARIAEVVSKSDSVWKEIEGKIKEEKAKFYGDTGDVEWAGKLSQEWDLSSLEGREISKVQQAKMKKVISIAEKRIKKAVEDSEIRIKLQEELREKLRDETERLSDLIKDAKEKGESTEEIQKAYEVNLLREEIVESHGLEFTEVVEGGELLKGIESGKVSKEVPKRRYSPDFAKRLDNILVERILKNYEEALKKLQADELKKVSDALEKRRAADEAGRVLEGEARAWAEAGDKILDKAFRDEIEKAQQEQYVWDLLNEEIPELHGLEFTQVAEGGAILKELGKGKPPTDAEILRFEEGERLKESLRKLTRKPTPEPTPQEIWAAELLKEETFGGPDVEGISAGKEILKKLEKETEPRPKSPDEELQGLRDKISEEKAIREERRPRRKYSSGDVEKLKKVAPKEGKKTAIAVKEKTKLEEEIEKAEKQKEKTELTPEEKQKLEDVIKEKQRQAEEKKKVIEETKKDIAKKTSTKTAEKYVEEIEKEIKKGASPERAAAMAASGLTIAIGIPLSAMGVPQTHVVPGMMPIVVPATMPKISTGEELQIQTMPSISTLTFQKGQEQLWTNLAKLPVVQPYLQPQPQFETARPVEVPEPVVVPVPEPEPLPEPAPLGEVWPEPPTPKPPKPKIIIPPPPHGKPKKDEPKKKVEYGTVIWRHGAYWEILEPPYDKVRHQKNPPDGAYRFATGKGSAKLTVQVLPRGAMLRQKEIRTDIGWAEVVINQDSSGEVEIDFIGHSKGRPRKDQAAKAQAAKEKKAMMAAETVPSESGRQLQMAELPVVPEPAIVDRGHRTLSEAEAMMPAYKRSLSFAPKKKNVTEDLNYWDRYYLGRRLPQSDLKGAV